MDRSSPNPASSQGTLKPSGGGGAPRRSFASRLFGYDIFLSFALGPPPRGTHSYASDLARRLRERDFTVFFSEDEAPPGNQLDTTLRTALVHSKALVVVANRGTLREPRFVRMEVEEFRECHPRRPVIAISVGGALEDPAVAESAQDWLGQQGRIWLDESDETVAMGIASEGLVNRLVTAPTHAKSNVKWKWLVRGVISVLAGLAIGLGVAAKIATNDARIALSRQLAAQSAAELTNDREKSLLLAMRALDTARTRQAEEALTNAVLGYPHRIALAGTSGPLWDVVFNADGQRVVTASKHGSVRCFAANTGGLLRELSGFQGPLYQVAFSQDGALMLGIGKSALVWNAKTLEPVNSDLSRDDDVSYARFSPSGEFIVTGHRDGTASLWESRTGTRVVEMRAHSGQIFKAAFSPKEDSIVTAGEDGVARIFNVPSGKLVSQLKGHTHRLLNADFSPDGRYILTAASPWPVNAEVASEERRGAVASGPLAGGREFGAPEPDNSVRIWNLRTGEVVVIQPPRETTIGAGFAPSGQVVWVNRNGYVMFYDFKGQRIGNGFNGRLASFSFDGSLFATIELQRTVRVRRMDDYAIVGVFPGEFAKFSPDGRRILTADADGSAFIWSLDEDLDRGGLRKSIKDFLSTSFSRNGAMVSTIDYRGTTRVWSGDTGADLTSTVAADLVNQRTREARFGGGTDILMTVNESGTVLLRNLATRRTVRLDTNLPMDHAEFSPDATRILTRIQRSSRTAPCNLQLWSSDTGSKVADICLSNEEILEAHFGSDGAWIQTTTASGGQIFDGHDGHHIPDFPGAHSYVSGSNRKWVAAFEDGRTVRIWDAPKERVVAELKAFARSDMSASMVEASFSPDGRLVMTQGEPTRVWDLATGKKVAEVDGEESVFSPDGRMVASVNPARNEMVARVWEARTGESLARTQAGRAVWRSVAFTPDGRWLLTTSDHSVGIWDAGTGKALRQLTISGSTQNVSVRCAPDARWLAVSFDTDTGKRDRLYPWERFSPVDDVVRFARTLVARELDPNEVYFYGINQE